MNGPHDATFAISVAQGDQARGALLYLMDEDGNKLSLDEAKKKYGSGNA
jgi:hypothetical protein